MKNSSDINALHSQVNFLKMQEKSTEELISIWTEYNQKVYSKDEFETIEKILRERISELPSQRKIYPDPYKTLEKKKTWAETKTIESAYFLSSSYIARRKEMATAMLVIIFLCLSFYCLFVIVTNWL